MSRIVCLAGLILAASTLQAQTVYKCIDKHGTPTFSTDPCGTDAQKVDVKPASGADKPLPPPPPAAPPMDAYDASADAACRSHAMALRAPPPGTSSRMQYLEQQKALYERQQQNTLHSNKSYNSISTQVANINNQIDQAYNNDQAEAQRLAEMSRQELAQCDRDRDLRAKQKAAFESVPKPAPSSSQ